MKDEAKKNIYCTNMDDDDPVIEKFLKDYLQEKDDTGSVKKNDDLMVNFDIVYADGKSESYTCGNESEVFGNRKDYFDDHEVKEEPKRESKYEPKREMKEDKCDKYYAEEKDSCDIESEIGKWTNCVDEWCECTKKEEAKKEKYECNEEPKQERYEFKCKEESKQKCEGKITVYSILSLKKSTTLKGVTVNLYKINGVKPELVASKVTDEDGVARFKDVKEGNYRIIQLIDKNYFEKPAYLTWNEVNITKDNKEYVLYVLNTLKNYKNN